MCAEERDREASLDFIREIVEADTRAGRHGGRVHTRFPPEPNGYLHIGHSKAICLDFGIAEEYGGLCNLRFDDTNPSKESVEYTDSIMEDFDWGDRLYYASDYFEQLYGFAERLIQLGKAFVCDLSPEQVRRYRGTLTEPGTESPYRNRSVDENLDLFRRMRAGEFPDGARTLRARIDMASPNVSMRDPVIYRILHVAHHRTGSEWCIYPMYDFTHCLSDSIEGITHSFCTLEFQDNRALYDWFIEQLGLHHPQQIEFARLNLSYTIMSKRKLLSLVEDGHVSGWDDPRMPTLCGLRRRGYPPEVIRSFVRRVGVARRDSVVDMSLLEHTLREHLNATSPRATAVLRPVRLVVENYPEDHEETLDFVVNPEDESAGTRPVPFCRELYIDADDFREEAPGRYHRLVPGREVRLRYAYLVTCTGFDRDPDTGRVTEVRCEYDPDSRGGDAPDGRKVRGTIHWVSARHCFDAEVRLYDRLFDCRNPLEHSDGEGFADHLNPGSLELLSGCKLEPWLAQAAPEQRFQFERHGYFCADRIDSAPGRPVFNLTVPLKDRWARIEKSLR